VFNGPAVEALLYLNQTLVVLALLHGPVHLVQYVLAAFIRLLEQLILSCVCCNQQSKYAYDIFVVLKTGQMSVQCHHIVQPSA